MRPTLASALTSAWINAWLHRNNPGVAQLDAAVRKASRAGMFGLPGISVAPPASEGAAGGAAADNAVAILGALRPGGAHR
ncbi:hypothetical protein [Elioraea sp.]|uniref:hypothetical protein n=1 Tax=Elioraea sp. TaxID=2185103 RepID=UPI003F6FECEE